MPRERRLRSCKGTSVSIVAIIAQPRQSLYSHEEILVPRVLEHLRSWFQRVSSNQFLPGGYRNTPRPPQSQSCPVRTRLSESDSSDIKLVINKMLVRHTKMIINGGPRIGDICLVVSCDRPFGAEQPHLFCHVLQIV